MASRKLQYASFGEGDALQKMPESYQRAYLRTYFADLGAKAVMEEPQYFDRDYLAEYGAFYSTSARPYGNVCSRIHFFSADISRSTFTKAAGGSEEAVSLLKQSYLGFVVRRPIPWAPLGKVIAKWYPDDAPKTPRITSPERAYAAHVAGVTLEVVGLPWQQQDSAVGACATVALWSLLHSSALAHHHTVPTTARITQLAHKTAAFGARTFPSKGLTSNQLCEAIKEFGLAPVLLDGDLKNEETDETIGFTPDRFASACASLIRSGYPVLLIGTSDGGQHAVCCVGFRETVGQRIPAGEFGIQDSNVQYVYLHDDNIGPNVRFEIVGAEGTGAVALKRSAPKPRHAPSWPDPTENWAPFVPELLIAAVDEGLRTTPDGLHKVGLRYAASIAELLKTHADQGVTLSTRFIRLPHYLDTELSRTLSGTPTALSRARMSLAELKHPMSLHLGVVRLALGQTPLVDILFDTTNNDRHLGAFAHVLFHRESEKLVTAANNADWGERVRAFV